MHYRFFIFLLSAIFLFSAHVQAQDRYTNVKIIPERTHVKAGEEIQLATEITLAPDWHVYWLNPGDSGIPVSVTWNLPEKFEMSDIKWPTPDKISYEILMNYGYYDKVVLLQSLKIPDTITEEKTVLTAKVDMLVCHEICIPETSTISIDLNDPSHAPEDNAMYIAEASAKLPKPIAGTFAYKDADKKLSLQLELDDISILNNAPAEKIEFFPQDLGIINHIAKPHVTANGNTISVDHERGDQPTDHIGELKGLLVVVGEKGQNQGYSLSAKRNQSLETSTVKKNNKVLSVPASTTTLLSAFLFALMGGLILNLMPCVFPVLSMKALSLVKMSDKEIKLARKHGLAYTAGIIISFLGIGGLLLILKHTGSAVGWGFQLQNPIVIALLIYMLFLLGLNLMGFFEIGTRFGNLGDKLTRKSGLTGSFFTGVLATVVATPCTAPFMGAAMGFALVQPAIISLSIFAALGLGLAFPYLFLSYVPAARKILPKPGAWMKTFKQFLAFPMFASSVWLIWVITQQSGAYGILVVLSGILCFAFAVWLSHHKGIVTRTLFIIFMVLPFLSLYTLTPVMPKNDMGEGTVTFGEEFTAEKLENLLNGDEPVFVEMTAAWCITCKVNHAVALNTDYTKNLFKEKKVRYLIGDWTNYNAEITQYLNTYQRDGVPIYVFYGTRDEKSKERPEPKILPQVLTSSIVEQAVGN